MTTATTIATTTALYSLVYSSTAASDFDDTSLQALLAQSRASNRDDDITGMLLYRRGRFVQFLEGPEERVRSLVARIAQDPRHTSIRIMLDGHPAARQFAQWTMGYEPVNEPVGPPPEGFRSTFDDLEDAGNADVVLRATRELSLWFRARSRQR